MKINMNIKHNTATMALPVLVSAIILAFALVLAGCGGQNAATNDTADPAQEAPADAGTDADANSASESAAENDADTAPENTAEDKTVTAEIPDDAQKIEAGGGLAINAAKVTDNATFYPLDVDGTYLEVVAVKATDGTVRTAFNTCQVCYDSGRGYYKAEGSNLVCQNCGNTFSADQVGMQAGGCNPVPITEDMKTVKGDDITIPYDLLVEAKQIFLNWKA